MNHAIFLIIFLLVLHFSFTFMSRHHRLFKKRRAKSIQTLRFWEKQQWIKPTQTIKFWRRRQWMLGLFVLIISVLVWRAIYLQVKSADFLQNQGNARYLRTVPIIAHRGMLMDRNGEPLAISTPVDSVWINPAQFATVQSQLKTLTKLLGIKTSELKTLLADRRQREFVYIKRHISPSVARQVNALKLPGVFLQREYRRYYPTGEVFAHVLGFTNVDDYGQEGLELALNDILKGVSGAKQVIQDKNRQIIDNVTNLRISHPGQNIHLSIDRRLQYLVYRELKAAVLRYQARTGSAVILDVRTGEVLAIVNQPAYNPNNRGERYTEQYRNRAITDVFEPGSTIKPFTIASALESGKYTPSSIINTHPGYLRLGKYTIRDSRNYGTINLAMIIKKSSNVGASKIGLSLSPKQLWQTLTQVGLGQKSSSGFPGEVRGYLPHFNKWHTARQASISFGYGVNLTLLQLARAYASLGNNGILPPIHFLSLNTENDLPLLPSSSTISQQVLQPRTAQQMLHILEAVIKSGGTGTLAQINGFRVAGKTGTVRKSEAGKYSQDKYLALFVGIVPVSAPRLVMAIIIDEPRTKNYYGGKVAAPIFAKVMSDALRLLNISPDDTDSFNSIYH
ncbi:penicillin-binding protein 2 [Candidatus Parabeggiatoa sp. HSG14]|uniref:peptidoglycan D,D-transpeptidase FtsI family protein n=1 Tax=Candidatus Parabeggiatoa sp. HSG14 TaxID=3055593 RepID=UPI0025A6B7EA|nr:penicillin-binding protein 2 [Thiotrichales bacterium HSG14]